MVNMITVNDLHFEGQSESNVSHFFFSEFFNEKKLKFTDNMNHYILKNMNKKIG